MTTDKCLRPLIDDGSDAQLWNESLKELEGKIGNVNFTWFKAPWLFTECYMYRRIREALLLCKTKFRDYDVYVESKREAYNSTEKTIISLISGLCSLNGDDERDLKEKHKNILLVSLWSNKNDLSLSSGVDNSHKTKNLLEQLENLKKFLLSNQTDEIWEHTVKLKERKESKRCCDIILGIFILYHDIGIHNK